MQLEIRVGRERRRRAPPRDSRCRPTRCRTVTPSGVGQRIGLVEREHARPNAGPHQGMAEPAAFLVGPVDQFQRRLGDDAKVVQRVHHLQPGQHAQRAVEFAARTAGCRGGCRTAPAGGSDRGRRGGRTCCRWRRPARSARRPRTRRGTGRGRACPRRSGSGGGRRPSAWRRSAGHRHQAVPQPLAVDALVGLGRSCKRPRREGAHLARRAVRCKTVPRIEPGTRVGMRAILVLAVGLLLAGCKLMDQTTFAPSPEAKTTDRRSRRRSTRAPRWSPSTTPHPARTIRACCAYAVHAKRRHARPASSTT